MQPRPDRLDVYYGSALVGVVHDSAPLAFEYSPGWLTGTQRMSLAAIPLQPGRQATPEVQAFFENLLPEGELRDYLAAQRKASTLFSLLLEVAGDTAGAFVLVAPGLMPEPPRYEATTWEAIAAILASVEKMSANLADISADMTASTQEVRGTLNNYGNLATDIRGLVRENRPALQRSLDDTQYLLQALAAALTPILTNIEDASRNLAALSHDLRTNPALILRSREQQEQAPWFQ